MRSIRRNVLPAAGLVAFLAGAIVSPAAADEMAQKRAAEIGLQPGDVLTASNASLAEGQLPPEILQAYKKGEWSNKVADWPDGKMKWEKEFQDGTRWNAEHLALDTGGGLVDKATGKKPDQIVGFPFPSIDPKDPQAGLKAIWNYFYGFYNHGNVKSYADLGWVSRKGVDRSASLESHLLYYDGQKAKYRPEKNPQNFLMQTLSKVIAPQDLYGTTFLSWRFRDSDKRDLNWTYLPALRRVREVSPANRSDGFLGSDMTQDDGPFFDGKPEDFGWSLTGDTEMYRLADPASLGGETERVVLPTGGWSTRWKTGPFVGFESPDWKGVPWAPLAPVLTKRKLWIVEAVPKDKYYLYGKIQLYIDKETFQGAWSRKYSWTGELLSVYVPLGSPNAEASAPDGSKEWFAGGGVSYHAGLNLKMDRATVTGFPFRNRDKSLTEVRIGYDPNFFDFQTLQKLGK